MTALQAQALLPFFVLAGGIVLVLMLVAWLRSEVVAFGATLAVLAASALTVPWAADAGAQTVDGLLTVDRFALFFFALFAATAIVTAILAFRYLGPRAAHRQEFYILLAIATLGAATTAAAANFAGLLLGIEVLSVSLYAMIAYPEESRPPLEGAAKYLILSGAASSTMLFGMALIYLTTGTLGFAFDGGEIARGDRTILALGQAMLLAGLFFKLSLVPFHMWTPDVYQGAPAPVTGFVATVSKAAVFAVLLRYALDSGLLASEVAQTALVVVAVLSMIGGNLLALLQTSMKRLLAYSSIAHLGYLLIALLVAGAPGGNRALGVETALVYLVGYFLMTLAAFGVVTVLSANGEDAAADEDADAAADAAADADELDAYEGLLWRRPALAAVLAATALALAGIPLTIGFIAKFYVVAAGVDGAAWTLIWALIIGSAIGVYYYLRIVFALTKREDADAEQRPSNTPRWEAVTAVLVLGILVVALGVYPTPLVDLVGGIQLGAGP